MTVEVALTPTNGTVFETIIDINKIKHEESIKLLDCAKTSLVERNRLIFEYLKKEKWVETNLGVYIQMSNILAVKILSAYDKVKEI